MSDPLGDFVNSEITQFSISLRVRLHSIGISLLDAEIVELRHFLLTHPIPQPMQVLEQFHSEIEAKGTHVFFVEKLTLLAASTLTPIQESKRYKQAIMTSLRTHPASATRDALHLTTVGGYAGPASEQLTQEIDDIVNKAEQLLANLYASEQADDALIGDLEQIIEQAATGIEVTGGTGIIITGVLFITALAQGFVDVFNDALDALAALTVGQVVSGVLVMAAIAAGVALFAWLHAQQELQQAPATPTNPVVIPFPVPIPTSPTKLTPEQEQLVQNILHDLAENDNVSGISQSDVENLIRLGYEKKDIIVILLANIPTTLSKGEIDRTLNDLNSRINETQSTFLPKEKRIAYLLSKQGKRVTAVPVEKIPGLRSPDAQVDGVPTEFKSLSPKGAANARSVKNIIHQSVKKRRTSKKYHY